MRLFTKLLRLTISALRKLGFSCLIYVDDSLLKGDDSMECKENVSATEFLLTMLGFHINYDKSILDPSQVIIFLGMLFNTVQMSLRLIEKRGLSSLQNVIKYYKARALP